MIQLPEGVPEMLALARIEIVRPGGQWELRNMDTRALWIWQESQLRNYAEWCAAVGTMLTDHKANL